MKLYLSVIGHMCGKVLYSLKLDMSLYVECCCVYHEKISRQGKAIFALFLGCPCTFITKLKDVTQDIKSMPKGSPPKRRRLNSLSSDSDQSDDYIKGKFVCSSFCFLLMFSESRKHYGRKVSKVFRLRESVGA